MVKRQYPKGKELAKSFVEKLKGYPNFRLISQSDVCHILIDNDEYYLYFKCLTHEGGPHPLEHQRAQLPKRDSFDKIKESDIPFLFIGYDVDHDVYVCWDPSKVKPRLNRKTYVSFYSRLSIQESVIEGEIQDEALTNGDKFVLFKGSDVLSFFQTIGQHFVELNKNINTGKVSEPMVIDKGKEFVGKILDINDDESLKLLIDNMKEESMLRIMSVCMNEFGKYYSNMSLTDWNNVIKKYLNKL